MRIYRHKRETLEGFFSLANTELRVGKISDTKGNQSKGISLYGGLHGPLVGADRAIVLEECHAKDLLNFLDRVQLKEFPSKFSVSMNRFETFWWEIARLLPEWHDGGGLSGRIGVYSQLGTSIFPTVLTIDAAQKLSACVADSYGIDY